MNKLLLLAVASFSIPLAHADTAFYPMICRGGSNVLVNNQTSMIFNETTGNVVNGGASSEVFFTKSAEAANANTKGANLAPGTCAWLDRGMRPGEASAIKYRSSPEITGIVTYTITSTTKVLGPLAGPTTFLTSTFNLLTSPNRSLLMWVRAAGDSFELKPKTAIEINVLP